MQFVNFNKANYMHIFRNIYTLFILFQSDSSSGTGSQIPNLNESRSFINFVFEENHIAIFNLKWTAQTNVE